VKPARFIAFGVLLATVHAMTACAKTHCL